MVDAETRISTSMAWRDTAASAPYGALYNVEPKFAKLVDAFILNQFSVLTTF